MIKCTCNNKLAFNKKEKRVMAKFMYKTIELTFYEAGRYNAKYGVVESIGKGTFIGAPVETKIIKDFKENNPEFKDVSVFVLAYSSKEIKYRLSLEKFISVAEAIDLDGGEDKKEGDNA